MQQMMRHVMTSSVMLGLFALAGTGMVSAIEHLAAPRIAANEEASKLKSLGEVVARDRYDNDILADTVRITDPALDRKQPAVVHIARNGDEPVAAIFEVAAPDGYSGTIRTLVGVNADGSLSGVRIVSHKETPGLGDAIDQQHGNWLDGFVGKSIGNPDLKRWAVKKDGGDFDQFTGATVSPRAVVGVVKRTLQYFNAHREQLFAAGEASK